MPEHHPSNQDILEHIDRVVGAHAKEDKEFQDATTLIHTEMNTRMDSLATKKDIEGIVVGAIEGYFQRKGKTAYASLLIVAGIVGALVVIGGGAKWFLGWLGFSYLGGK